MVPSVKRSQGDITSLFHETSPLSASPDIGWPDAFNSGLLSLPPSDATFEKLLDFAVDNGSWDGADQGLLNDFFGEALDAAEADAGGRKEWGSWKSSVEGETNGGALDGWRGPGWKRLSFRYNVTPNGGYTWVLGVCHLFSYLDPDLFLFFQIRPGLSTLRQVHPRHPLPRREQALVAIPSSSNFFANRGKGKGSCNERLQHAPQPLARRL